MQTSWRQSSIGQGLCKVSVLFITWTRRPQNRSRDRDRQDSSSTNLEKPEWPEVHWEGVSKRGKGRYTGRSQGSRMNSKHMVTAG